MKFKFWENELKEEILHRSSVHQIKVYPSKISVEDVLNSLNTQNAKCPICKHDEFGIHPTLVGINCYLRSAPLEVTIDDSNTILFKTSCMNCGYVIFYDAGVINKKRKELESKKEAKN